MDGKISRAWTNMHTEDTGEVESRIAPSEFENWEYGAIN